MTKQAKTGQAGSTGAAQKARPYSRYPTIDGQRVDRI